MFGQANIFLPKISTFTRWSKLLVRSYAPTLSNNRKNYVAFGTPACRDRTSAVAWRQVSGARLVSEGTATVPNVLADLRIADFPFVLLFIGENFGTIDMAPSGTLSPIYSPSTKNLGEIRA